VLGLHLIYKDGRGTRLRVPHPLARRQETMIQFLDHVIERLLFRVQLIQTTIQTTVRLRGV